MSLVFRLDPRLGRPIERGSRVTSTRRSGRVEAKGGREWGSNKRRKTMFTQRTSGDVPEEDQDQEGRYSQSQGDPLSWCRE